MLCAGFAHAQNMPYTNQTEIGLLAGEGIDPSFSVQTFNGFKIKEWNVEAGLNTGVDIYKQFTLLPVSIGLKWFSANPGTVSPFIGLNAGYGLDWLQRREPNQKYEGGFMINPSVGIRIKTQARYKLNLSLGYKEQKAVIHQSQIFESFSSFFAPQMKDTYRFKRISLNLGLSF